MKKTTSILLTICMIFTLTSCGKDKPPTENPPPKEAQFDGKIAILTHYQGGNDLWYTALPVIEKYGDDKIIHETWPVGFVGEHEDMVNTVTQLAKNLEIKAVVMNSVTPDTVFAIEKLRELRQDIFIVCCVPSLLEPDSRVVKVAQTGDLVLMIDWTGMGPAMVRQAQKLGAKTFIHYSSPKCMSNITLAARRDMIKQECAKVGMEFVDSLCEDPATIDANDRWKFFEQSILEDVIKMVATYGKDTAFFRTDDYQSLLIRAVIETGAIYPQPQYPSPFHGFTYALGFESWDGSEPFPSVVDTINQTKAALAERDMPDRFSTWPVYDEFMYTSTATEYAIKWINCEVPKEGIDVQVLKQLMEDYAGVEVYLTPYVDEYPYTENGTGKTYDNFLLMRMDYITY